jgi:hypothetical protein
VLAAVLLMGWFSPEIYDTDFWWHLKTGQYVVEKHALPVPDPFAHTTGMRGPAYAGEEITRHFNLTHEWLAQTVLYLVYRAAGFPGIVLYRAALLALFCGLAGLIAYRRCGGFYRSLLAALAAAWVTGVFALDRPYLITFVLLAASIAILEYRRWIWVLPVLFLVWANAHGGFFLGWVVLAAYAAEALLLRIRKRPAAGDRALWVICAVSFLVSGINPNGFRIPQILGYYRSSFLTSRLLEWTPPRLWALSGFTVLLFGAAAALIWARRKARLVDWLLFAAFAVAAVAAQRNIFLVALWAPVLIAAYLPWKRPVPRFAAAALAVAMASGIAAGVARGRFFQLHVAEWKFPAGAADFLIAHGVTAPIFNTYEYGGYLIWRLWPQERVFIDGRALSESVFMDYMRILYNHDESGGRSAQQLLDDYGIQTLVMNGFEYGGGLVYLLAPALADPSQTDWKLVYTDPQSMVFMRQPPPGVEPLNSLRVLDHLEAECELHIAHEPQYPRCARGLGEVFLKVGDRTRARRWIGVYLSHAPGPDPEAEQAYRNLL